MNKLVINRSSWHYKLIWDGYFSGGTTNVPHNLCPYFWALMRTVVLEIIIFCFMIFLASALVTVPLAVIIASIVSGHWEPSMTYVFPLCIIALTILSLLHYAFNQFSNKFRESKPTLIGSYIKAKHNKLCPILEFED